jgi:hypothetical protein
MLFQLIHTLIIIINNNKIEFIFWSMRKSLIWWLMKWSIDELVKAVLNRSHNKSRIDSHMHNVIDAIMAWSPWSALFGSRSRSKRCHSYRSFDWRRIHCKSSPKIQKGPNLCEFLTICSFFLNSLQVIRTDFHLI